MTLNIIKYILTMQMFDHIDINKAKEKEREREKYIYMKK